MPVVNSQIEKRSEGVLRFGPDERRWFADVVTSGICGWGWV
jgi:hypothetical protein